MTQGDSVSPSHLSQEEFVPDDHVSRQSNEILPEPERQRPLGSQKASMREREGGGSGEPMQKFSESGTTWELRGTQTGIWSQQDSRDMGETKDSFFTLELLRDFNIQT
jgi:hypothetical protein